MTDLKYDPPEFIEVATGEKVAYVAFEEAVSNPAWRGPVVASALNEADQWFQRYAAFFDRIADHEGLEIVKAINQVKEKLGASWPSLDTDGDGGNGLIIGDDES